LLSNEESWILLDLSLRTVTIKTVPMDGNRFIFEEFELDASAFELLHSGERVRLERIPMELLLLLVSRHGELVSREEIVDRLWGREIFIDTNTAINVAIRKIRQVLGDNIENPRYILTVPAKGYRFIGAIASLSFPSPHGLEIRPPFVAEISGESVPAAGGPAQGAIESEVAPRTAAPAQPAPGAARSRFRRSNWLVAIAASTLLLVLVPALLRSKHAAPPGRLMFVVLPFENLTGDPSQDYIADGMTEEMITQMGVLNPGHIGVIARTSSMQFKGTQKSAAEIAQELGVGYLLEGSIRHVGDRIRVTAQLIQASDQTHLWAADYDSDLSDLLKLESDIAGAIATQVQVKLNFASGKRFAHSALPPAQTAYLRGLEEWNLRTRSSITGAISEFQGAIAADPNYALPYAALARCYAIGPIFGVGDPAETMPRARELSRHALELDPGLAEAHSVLAVVAAHYDFDWPTAQSEFQTALRLNPSDPYAHLLYSNSYLSPHGRHPEAIEEMKEAIALDPLSVPLEAFLIRSYVWARRYDDARSQFERTNEVAPTFAVLHERMAHLLASVGDFDHAIEEDARARLLSGEQAEQVVAQKDQQWKQVTRAGARGYWQAQLQLSGSVPAPPEAYMTPFGMAIVNAQIGLTDSAFRSLEEAYARRDVQLTEINVEPAFDKIRSDPRFQSLLGRVHLIGR
jgi:TolB-like protein/DNA-binding winged helix-turn-helix (wHTH) protein/Tfp pilus assembly protein PilF